MILKECMVHSIIGNRSYVDFIEEYQGYKMLGIFNRHGFRCGYVVLPKDHKYYEEYYGNIPIECHGGLTFSGELRGELSGEYCIGFDCGHAGDGQDYALADTLFKSDLSNIFKDFNRHERICSEYYVLQECKAIVDQLIKSNTTETDIYI